jgi:hypothetical protein
VSERKFLQTRSGRVYNADLSTMRVACITLDGVTLVCPISEFAGMFDDEGEGYTYTLTFKTMTMGEYEALGEFNGF